MTACRTADRVWDAPRAAALACALMLGLPTALCHAAPEGDAEAQAIVVEGIRTPYRLSYAKLLLARQAFDEHRHRAPGATFRFHVHETDPPGTPLMLHLRMGDDRLELALDAEGNFAFPQAVVAAPEESQVVANRRSSRLKVRPRVRTPGLGPHTYRLGDLRVSCEAFWAMEREDVPLFYRAAFSLAGGVCKSSSISMAVSSNGPIASATIKANGHDLPVRVSADGLSFHPPLHDTTLSDDALLVVEPKAAAGTPQTPAMGS